jgi:hypothetical protein
LGWDVNGLSMLDFFAFCMGQGSPLDERINADGVASGFLLFLLYHIDLAM